MTNATHIDQLKISADANISEVITCIHDSGSLACALIYDQIGRFMNIITDGDIRRAFLEGKNLDDRAIEIQHIKLKTTRPTAITAHVHSTNTERESVFRRHSLRQLVLVDDQGSPVSILGHQYFNSTPTYINHGFTAVVMAGGFGTRLRPLTQHTPKPMLAINGRPILEISIEKLVRHGARRIFISTHYLPEKIKAHFGSGEQFGVPIEYIHEEVPLGTGGTLSRIPYQDENTLVFNGDILTDLDIGMFLAHHLRSHAAMTIAATQYSVQVPFGVVSEDRSRVTHIEEKPCFNFLVNSGIYFLARNVFETLPESGAYHMTDVAQEQIRRGRPVSCFPIFEHWLDVGSPSDYNRATQLFQTLA